MMPPLVDMHCHLLAGLDDGPRTEEEALAMCRLAYQDGVRVAAAGAHQNEHYPKVTPQRIRLAAGRLAEMLLQAGIPLTVFPCAEVMAEPETPLAWSQGQLLSVADRGQYVLLELPDGVYVDLTETVTLLRQAGVRTIVAHPERCEEFLHDPGRIECLLEAGCLVQVSAKSITAPRSGKDERALRSWLKRGVVHLLGSDGHSPVRRPPVLAQAYRRLVRWVGAALADQICSTNGLAIVGGRSLQPPRPRSARRSWFWSLR